MPFLALNPRFYGTAADEYITHNPWTGVSSSVSAVKWEVSGGHYQFRYNFFTRTFDTVWVPEELTSSPYDGLTTGASEYITAGGGNDYVASAGGNDLIYAGSGNDTVIAGSGNDTVDGGTGDDTVDGGAGDDTIYGQGGNDTIYANQGSDRVNPGSGDDTVYAGGGYSEFGSASGRTLLETSSDGIDLSEINADLFIVAYDQDFLDRFHDGDSGLYYPQMTHAINGRFDSLNTGAGNDVIYTNRAGDGRSLSTGAGDDIVYYSGGDTDIRMGSGDDILDLRGDARHVLEGESRVVHYYNSAGIHDLGDGDDIFYARPDINSEIGGGGGNDSLYGYLGDDSFIGGEGSDYIAGGDGDDTFHYSFVRHSRPGAAQRDTIIGFDGAGNGTGDIIDVSGIDARWTGSGDTSDQAFTFGGSGIGRIWTENDSSGNTLVRAENNNIAGVDFEILIADGDVDASAYTAADFML